MPDKLIIEAEPREISALITIVNILHNNKEGYVHIKYNNGGSTFVVHNEYFKNGNMRREHGNSKR